MPLDYMVIHPGTQHSWQTALALQQLDRLQAYATSIFYQPGRWPYRIEQYLPEGMSNRLHAEFKRLSHPSLDPSLIQTGGMAEWAERLAVRAGFRNLAKRIDWYGNARFAAKLRREIASSSPFGVWSYDNCSREVFRTAKARGRRTVLDRTNGDWRAFNRILSDVYEGYADFFPSKNFRVPDQRIDHNDEEYSLADVILVGSPFAASTVRENAKDRSAADRVRVLNYCFDEMLFGSQPPPVIRPADEPLRFLFVGQAGVRKGIHLILKVFQQIPVDAASLTIVGDLQIPPAAFAPYADRVRYIQQVPRSQMPSLMRDADVLLFPSYFEGSAISLIEGLASGLAIIQSENAGCGVTPATGHLLEALTEQALQEAVLNAIENRDLVAHWRQNAQAEASRYTFANYRQSISELIASLENSTPHN